MKNNLFLNLQVYPDSKLDNSLFNSVDLTVAFRKNKRILKNPAQKFNSLKTEIFVTSSQNNLSKLLYTCRRGDHEQAKKRISKCFEIEEIVDPSASVNESKLRHPKYGIYKPEKKKITGKLN